MEATITRSVERPVSERFMFLALAGVIVFLAFSEGTNWKLSLGYGMSVKNALLYLLALALVLKFAVRHNFAFEVGEIYACFAVMIGYAIVSMAVAGFLIKYQGYHLIQAGIGVKTRLRQHALGGQYDFLTDAVARDHGDAIRWLSHSLFPQATKARLIASTPNRTRIAPAARFTQSNTPALMCERSSDTPRQLEEGP